MQIIIKSFIFCIILFTYLHIQFHIKTSDDLEIFEVDEPSKQLIEDICDLRQPTLFNLYCQEIANETCLDNIVSKYNAFDIKIRNTKDTMEANDVAFLALPLHSLQQVLQHQDASLSSMSTFISEKNMDFLVETNVRKYFQGNDLICRPPFVSNCYYDIIIGTCNSFTPFRYELNYRNYFITTQGSVEIKLCPPKYKRYLFAIHDYDNFEFYSPINPWQPQSQYTSEFNKVKCLQFTLPIGKTFFLPPYWWYSIKFNNQSSVSVMKYRTIMNNIAIFPQLSLHTLQSHNIRPNIAIHMFNAKK
jgi:hypothetical protein